MSVMVAVPDSTEGHVALDAAVAEARRSRTELVIVNLGLVTLNPSDVPEDVPTTTIERNGEDDRDPANAVLDEITDSVERLVIGIKRRTPVGKALLGSVSQRLLLESPVPVLAVKTNQ